MNLATVIGSIRSEWAANVGIPLHFQTAPPDAQIPYAVMVLGQIDDGGNGDTSTQEFETTVQFAAFVADDPEAIGAMDAMNDTFGRGRVANVYSSQYVTGQLTFQYTDQAAFWLAESSYSIRWTKEL